ncbi:MAG: hypothetical protein RLY86_344 [Pseudomonadota bacterium]|jgi:uncharacterized protein YjbI with pentapeptide repeats
MTTSRCAPSLRLVPLVLALILLAVPASAACTDPAEPNVNWRRCYMDSRNLDQVRLAGAMLREATFQRSSLAKADLTGVDAYRAKFVSARLPGVVLDRARLIEADMTRADLAGASLVGADLRNAKLVNTDLRGAVLTDARLTGADLRNADLTGATWVDGTRICGAGSIGQCH